MAFATTDVMYRPAEICGLCSERWDLLTILRCWLITTWIYRGLKICSWNPRSRHTFSWAYMTKSNRKRGWCRWLDICNQAIWNNTIASVWMVNHSFSHSFIHSMRISLISAALNPGECSFNFFGLGWHGHLILEKRWYSYEAVGIPNLQQSEQLRPLIHQGLIPPTFQDVNHHWLAITRMATNSKIDDWRPSILNKVQKAKVAVDTMSISVCM